MDCVHYKSLLNSYIVTKIKKAKIFKAITFGYIYKKSYIKNLTCIELFSNLNRTNLYIISNRRI